MENVIILITGHNYDLEVMVTGEVDSESGYLIDMKVLSDMIKSS